MRKVLSQYDPNLVKINVKSPVKAVEEQAYEINRALNKLGRKLSDVKGHDEALDYVKIIKECHALVS